MRCFLALIVAAAACSPATPKRAAAPQPAAPVAPPTEPPIGEWRSAGDMIAARAWYGLAPLPSGRVLAVGGEGAGRVPLDSAEIFDPATDTWQAAAPMAVARANAAVSALPDGTVLVAGGSTRGASGMQPTASAEIFDEFTSAWTAVPDMTTPRSSPRALPLADGRILVTGGGRYEKSAEIFDPTTRQWRPVAPMRAGRTFHSALVLPTGEGLVLGGRMRGAELFDPDADRWRPTRAMSFEHDYLDPAVLLDDGRVLALANRADAAELYDPEADDWDQVPGPELRAALAVRLLDGRVLALGVKAASLFDPEAMVWRPATPLSSPRFAHGAVVLRDGRVLVPGGNAHGKLTPATELFSVP